MGFFDWFSAKKNKDNTDDAGMGAESMQDTHGKDEVKDQVHTELKVQDECEAEAPKAEEQGSAATGVDARQDVPGKNEIQDQVYNDLKMQDEHETEVIKAEEEGIAEADTQKNTQSV